MPSTGCGVLEVKYGVVCDLNFSAVRVRGLRSLFEKVYKMDRQVRLLYVCCFGCDDIVLLPGQMNGGSVFLSSHYGDRSTSDLVSLLANEEYCTAESSVNRAVKPSSLVSTQSHVKLHQVLYLAADADELEKAV